jgi:hypothetical protein
MFSRHSYSLAALALALAGVVTASCAKSGPDFPAAGTAAASSSGQPDIQLLKTNDLTISPPSLCVIYRPRESPHRNACSANLAFVEEDITNLLLASTQTKRCFWCRRRIKAIVY